MAKNWDAHADLQGNHSGFAAEVDQPIAGLLTDLKSQGLLDSTLIICGGEFGRTSDSQGSDGRDIILTHLRHGSPEEVSAASALRDDG